MHRSERSLAASTEGPPEQEAARNAITVRTTAGRTTSRPGRPFRSTRGLIRLLSTRTSPTTSWSSTAARTHPGTSDHPNRSPSASGCLNAVTPSLSLRAALSQLADRFVDASLEGLGFPGPLDREYEPLLLAVGQRVEVAPYLSMPPR